MNNEKQQARHDIDVIKASLRAVIKQIFDMQDNSPSYRNPIENRVLTPLYEALAQLNEIYNENWTSYVATETFINAVKTLDKLKIK